MTLGDASNWAQILTAVVSTIASIVAYGVVFGREHSNRKRLEKYLQEKWDKYSRDAKTPYIHSVVHLMAVLGMTEQEVLKASFTSKHIQHQEFVPDNAVLATEILFEWSKEPLKKPGAF